MSPIGYLRLMRWVSIVLLFLLSNPLSAQVEEYWFSNKSAPNSWPVNNVVLDDTGNPIVPIRAGRITTQTDTLGIITTDEKTHQLPLGPGGGFFIATTDSNGLRFENLSGPLENVTYQPKQVIAAGPHLYFVWYSSFTTDSIDFFNQRIGGFTRKGLNNTITIIQTDKKMKVTGLLDFKVGFASNAIEDIVSTDRNGLFILWSNESATIQSEVGHITIPALAGAFSYNLLEVDAGMYLLANIVYHNAPKRPFYDGFGRRTLQAVRNHFSTGLHFYNTDEEGDFYNEYELREIYSSRAPITLSKHTTNLKVSTLASNDDATYFLGECAYNEPLVYFDKDTLLFDKNYSGDALFLNRLGRDGSFRPLATIRGLVNYQSAHISLTDNKIWLKVHAGRSFYLEDLPSFSIENASQIVYLVYDLDGNLLAAQGGPGELPSYWYSNFATDGKYVYDANLYGSYFYLDNVRITPPPGKYSGQSTVYTKTKIVFAPLKGPGIFVEKDGCDALNIRYNKTDADHYTVLVSQGSPHKLPIDYENYNYSYNYLKAHNLSKKTKVVYQGPDTAIRVYNLPSNRMYYIAVVPGNGPAGLSIYNRDSTDSTSIFFAASSWQDSIDIVPNTDTAACEGDSVFLTANGSLAPEWMDKKQEDTRYLKNAGDYYFTSKAEDGCLLSSDTVNFRFLEPATISKLDLLDSLPYCLGDTLSISAVSSHNYSWQHGDSTADIRITASGTYLLTATSDEGCEASDSIVVSFSLLPSFNFLEDSVIISPEQLAIPYSSNADSLSWYYLTDTAHSFDSFTYLSRNYIRVQAFTDAGCFVRDSLLTTYYNITESIFPNAFSPNGDGLNDVWYYIHPETSGTLTIFDRWGGVVFHGDNYWNGKKLGETLPVGEYTYVLKTTQNKTEGIKSGKIQLIR